MPVARIELPSGAWVDVRDKLRPADRWAVRDAPEVSTGEDGRVIVANALSATWKAFYTRLITAWSFQYPDGRPVPLPAADPSVLDDYPDDEDDAAALEDALQPRLDRLRGRRPNPSRTSGTSPPS